MGGSLVAAWTAVLLTGPLLLPPWGVAQPEPTPTTQPSGDVAPTPVSAPTGKVGDAREIRAELAPRFELHIPSLKRLVAEARRSHSGMLAEHLVKMVVEMGSISSEGVDVEGAVSLLSRLKTWPDTSIDVVTYAPDTEGRQRWAVRIDWPLDDLHARLEPLLALEAAATLLEGVRLTPRPQGGHTIALPRATLAYLLPWGDGRSILASHPDLEFPAAPFQGTQATEKGGASLLVCRLNLQGTERDSGATFWSSFSAVTDATYACRVDGDREWVEAIDVHWPPIVGTGAKAMLGKVKQTFFVPHEAYGSAVMNPRLAAGLLESMAGLGPQLMADESGGFTMVGEVEVGPIAANTGSELCVTVLPGTGFMPVPDVVIQVKAKRAEKLIDELREATEKINKLLREREQPEPWHEAEVKDRAVFWSDGASGRRGLMMPLVMRPVLFVTQEVDARGRDRDFLVLGLTSTSPERLVRRWVEMPRPQDRRFLPAKKKTSGQVWFHWQQAYQWMLPYANLGLSVISRDLLLPRVKDLTDDLTDASLTAKIKYSGLSVSHRGPIPAGIVVVPVLLGIATAEDVSGASDLARERMACRRLKVLQHHATLFEKDMGRWPAELAELDGYVDFAGHPELLRIELSSKKQRGKWLEKLLGSDEEEEDDDDQDEDEDELVALDDDLFVIDWGRDSWTLGIAPGTFEHLDRLYIDRDGNIHRVEKKPSKQPDDQEAGD